MINNPSQDVTKAIVRNRDCILLPILSFMTIGAILFLADFTARRLYYKSKTTMDSCLVLNDRATGVRGVPNSVCWEKVPEDQLVEYRFDSCGFRSAMPCGPKAPGRYRIVLAGSSVAIGERVPVGATFGSLLPELLRARTGRQIELYNEGMAYGFPRTTALQFDDVLAQQPDLILWVLTPSDIGEGEFLYAEEAAAKSSNKTSSIWTDLLKVSEAIKTHSLGDKIRIHMEMIPTGLMLEHLLYKYESQDQYIKSYLEGPDRVSGFLKTELSGVWKSYLDDFNQRATVIANRSSAAGVTLVVAFLPNRPQAAMLSKGDWPPGYDPYRLNQDLRAIVESHGGIFVDVLPAFRSIVRPEQFYLPVDGHPTAPAHAIFAELLADGLTNGRVPDLRVPVRDQVAAVKGK